MPAREATADLVGRRVGHPARQLTIVYVRDPDGNQVELQVDNYPDTESLHAWFRSGAFTRNPMGETYDPEQLLARHRAGEPEQALLTPTW